MNRRQVMRASGAASALLALGACSGFAAAPKAIATASGAVGKVVATVETDISTVVNNYLAAKGIGQIAVAALALTNPTAAKAITAAIGIADKIVANVPEGETTGTAIATAASGILAQTSAILAAADGGYVAIKAAV